MGDQIADENEAKKAKALQDRKDHIDRVAKTMGAAVAERDAKDAADLEAKIKQIQDDANRRAMEDNQRRLDIHNAKVKDMVETRQRKMAFDRQRSTLSSAQTAWLKRQRRKKNSAKLEK